VQGFFSFSLLVFRPKRALVGWCAFEPRLGIVLASFWLRFFFAYATVAVVLRAAKAAERAMHKQ
jgi:hypothetical protein